MLEQVLRTIIREEVTAALREHAAAMQAAAAPSPAQPSDGRAVLTQRELRERWRVSLTYLSLLRAMGLMKVVRFGSRVLIPVEEVARIERDGLPPVGSQRRRNAPAPLSRRPADPMADAEHHR